MKTSILNKIHSVGFINKTMFPHWVRLLIWSLQLPKAPYMLLTRRLIHLWDHNGPTFLVFYTKECVRILQAYVSGHPVLSTNLMQVGLSGGLPSILPGDLRSLIRSGDLVTIRGCLSILQVYRVLKVPGKLKLSTITDPFKGLSSELSQYEVVKAISEIGRLPILQKITLKYSSTAGPNHPVSMLGIWKDILAWKQSPLLPILLSFIDAHKLGGVGFKDLLLKEMSYLTCNQADKPLKLGKLSLKDEAAGKVRVFAIADSITQSVLRPLHKAIFLVLKSLPMDGTHDQDAPLRRLLDRVNSGQIVDPTFYSYDLSAATDRLPISFQKQVLACYLGDDYATLWADLLVKRDWYLYDKSSKRDVPYRYSVGQPMGALSSWAMLALTHHVIVRIAARRLGLNDFSDYALLGDDIVIAHEGVAKAYHELMVAVLGVEINLSKSLISKHSFEFAKRLITLKGEVSAIGAKNLLVALKSLKGLPSLLLDLRNKGFALSEELVSTYYRSIPTVRKSQVKRMMWLVQGPFGFVPTADGLSASLKLTNSLSAVSMDSLLSSIDQALFELAHATWEGNVYRTIFSFKTLLVQTKPAGLDIDIKSSPIYQYIIEDYRKMVLDLVENEPVRRFIFDGPLVFVNYYRETWMKEMMDYITSKIKANLDVTTSPIDPFADEKVFFPLQSVRKSENFWLAVRRIEDEKSSVRGFKGW